MSAYVYVDGIASSVSMEVLVRLFNACGTVRSVDMLPKINGESLGIAKVQMGSPEEADQAIEIMNKATLNGKVLLVYKEPETNTHIQGPGSST
jgi:RNA recognition motif-containing protein